MNNLYSNRNTILVQAFSVHYDKLVNNTELLDTTNE